MRFIFPSCRTIIAMLAFGITTNAAGEVTESSSNGFTISLSQESRRSDAELWERLQHPENWWSSAHSWSGDAANMSVEMRAGGCWCERVGDGVAVHGRIIRIDSGHAILFDAPLGPLNDAAVATRLSWRVENQRVIWRYQVYGALPMPTEQLTPLVEGVLAEQLRRLTSSNS